VTSPEVIAKGLARARKGRVTFLPRVAVYAVEGDTPDAVYRVTVMPMPHMPPVMECTCPATTECWHMVAVRERRRKNGR
jgi:hypothetical protein